MPSKKVFKLIYNPHAGEKRKHVTSEKVDIHTINQLLTRFEIEFKAFATKSAGHATKLAREAEKEGYYGVIVAGGDGTFSEVASGLIGSKIVIGILPMGTFMNIARMLSVPNDIEKAIELIKIGKKRRIDAGVITALHGQVLQEPHYFFESVGLGLEAEIHKSFKEFEKGNLLSLIQIVRMYLQFYANSITLKTDSETITTRATVISIANGPFSGAGLQIAPEAKLNDNLLTLTLYPLSKLELITHFLKMKVMGKIKEKRLRTIQTRNVSITASHTVSLHADARIFSQTPANISIHPRAVHVITGFPVLSTDERDFPQ